MSQPGHKWNELYESQYFDDSLLDYSIVEQHKQLLDYLSTVGNSASFIFDLYKRQYIYASQNFTELLGMDLRRIVSDKGLQVSDDLLHPDDNSRFEQMQFDLYTFLFSLPVSRKKDYKHIYSFRVLNSENEYIRFVSQQQVLELDGEGNIWLIMGIIDLAPDQNASQEFECSILDYKTGKRLSVADFTDGTVRLTKREKEVLNLIKDGLLSKEISGKLSISINTVNIHRQNILQKTHTNNSIEAIKFAEKMGLL